MDLYHLLDLIESYIPDVAVYVQNVKDVISQAVVANWYSSPEVANAHGLSFWCPDPANFSTDEWSILWKHYLALDFARASKWPEALQDVWNLK